MKYNYSIIIPHHNIPHLLKRCLDSIPRREDIQIIIIDDNSDSAKVDFKKFPGLEDPKVHLIFSKKGKGAGAARNEGLEVAKGKWLIFVDSDDFLTENALNIWDRYLTSDFDIVYSMVTSVDCETLQLSDRHLEKENSYRKYKESKDKLSLWLRYSYTEPWGKLIKREFIIKNNIKFQESKVANDFLFSIKSGYYANRITFCEDMFYKYTVRSGSLSNNQYDSKEKVYSRLEVYYTVEKFAKVHGIGIRPFFFFF